MKKIIIIISSLVLVFLVIPMLITCCTHSYYFGSRLDYSNNYFEYLSDSKFSREKISFESYDNTLNGYFYSQSDISEYKGVLIWVHGMGVSHENYLAEFDYFTRDGYVIFSYDNTGVSSSEGKSLKGLTQSVLDLQNALIFLYELNLYNDIPNVLVGHSWGGFSVASVSSLDLPREVDGIITLAGFWKNINVIKDIAQYYVSSWINLLIPYLISYEYMLFGSDSNLNGVDGLSNTNAKVLMIHSTEDVIVHFDSNFLYYKEKFGNDSRFAFSSYENCGHQLTITKESYDRIHDIVHHQYDLDVNSSEYTRLEEERLSLIQDFNYDVLNDISLFLNYL